jgi:cellulose biosynthesis protein BcsQ
MTMKGLAHRLLHFLVDLEEQGRGYELVIVDTHPSDDRLSLNAVHAADMVISPFAAEPDAYIGPRNVMVRLQEIEQDNRRQIPVYLLPTMYSQKNGSPSADFVAAVNSRWGTYPDGLVLPHIMDSDVIKSTVSFGQTMYEYRPGHRTTEQFDRILDIVQEVSYAKQ